MVFANSAGALRTVDPALIHDTFCDGLHSVTHRPEYMRLTFYKLWPSEVSEDVLERAVGYGVILTPKAYYGMLRILRDAGLPAGMGSH